MRHTGMCIQYDQTQKTGVSLARRSGVSFTRRSGVSLPRRNGVYLREISTVTMGYKYEYDQLNRLIGMKAFTDILPDSNQWSSGSAIADFQEAIHYDANGNILKYFRNGTTMGSNPLAMDSLFYQYTSGTNRLSYVLDSVPSGNYTIDIDKQRPLNYLYTADGNMMVDSSEGLWIYWNTYGKVDSISNRNSHTALKFVYDPSTNRVEKRYFIDMNTTPKLELTTFYIRDPQGNILSIYERDDQNFLTWSEIPLYGSSRLGVFNADTIVWKTGWSFTNAPISNLMSGNKVYELTNHLGNVLATISDQKLPVDTNGGGTDFYAPIFVSAQDYYPFGMPMPERNISSSDYRFGFNGQEKVDELSGTGNHNTALFWEYDTRLGRRWNIDPKPNASISNYVVFANCPILMNDPLGDTTYLFNTKGIFIGTILDNLGTNEVVFMSESTAKIFMKFHNQGTYSADILGKVARTPQYAYARITKHTRDQLYENRQSRGYNENMGLLWINSKTKELQTWKCPDCGILNFKADEDKMFDRNGFKGKTDVKGLIFIKWHSHTGTTDVETDPTKDYAPGGKNEREFPWIEFNLEKQIAVNGLVGLILSDETFTIFHMKQNDSEAIGNIKFKKFDLKSGLERKLK